MGCFDEVIIPLVLILPKMSGYVKTFKEKNNKSMSLRIDDENLLEKYEAIWTKTDLFIHESFTIIFIDSVLVYESKYYLTVYVCHCAYKTLNTLIVDYIGDNHFESDKN